MDKIATWVLYIFVNGYYYSIGGGIVIGIKLLGRNWRNPIHGITSVIGRLKQ